MKRQSFLISGAGAVLAGCARSAVPSGSPAGTSSQSAMHGSPKRSQPGDQLLGSLLLVPYDYTPAEFAECDGKLMSIDKNLALFSLLYTKFGGNGKTDFALPDARRREPIKGLTYVIAIEGIFPSRKFRERQGGGTPPLLGQLLLVPYVAKFIPPPGWAVADGAVLPIRGNQELYSLIGSKFGGDGQQKFALPDLRGHAPHKDVTYLIAMEGRYPDRA
jgi:microcystin-dependent protein